MVMPYALLRTIFAVPAFIPYIWRICCPDKIIPKSYDHCLFCTKLNAAHGDEATGVLDLDRLPGLLARLAAGGVLRDDVTSSARHGPLRPTSTTHSPRIPPPPHRRSRPRPRSRPRSIHSPTCSRTTSTPPRRVLVRRHIPTSRQRCSSSRRRRRSPSTPTTSSWRYRGR